MQDQSGQGGSYLCREEPCLHNDSQSYHDDDCKESGRYWQFGSYCEYKRWIPLDLACNAIYGLIASYILFRALLAHRSKRKDLSYLDPISIKMRLWIPLLCVLEAMTRVGVEILQIIYSKNFPILNASLLLLIPAAIHLSIFTITIYARAKNNVTKVMIIIIPILCISMSLACDIVTLSVDADFFKSMSYSIFRIIFISLTNMLYAILLISVVNYGKGLFDSFREERARQKLIQAAHIAATLYCFQMIWRIGVLSETIEYDTNVSYIHLAVYFIVESCPRLVPNFIILLGLKQIWPRRKPGTLHSPLLSKLKSSTKTSFVSDQLDLIFGPLSSELYIDFSELELGPKIAQGGVGSIYKAYLGGTEVAAKALVAVNDDSNEFEREARMLQRVHHPHIVMFYGLAHNEINGNFYIITEYCADSLPSKIKNFSRDDFFRYAIDLADTIQFLHRRDIVHRDLKPANILIDSFGSLKICDLGLATLCSFDTHRSIAGGTPAYMPPEIAKFGAPKIDRSYYDLRSWDTYSLGMIYYYMWMKEIPFKGLNPYQILFESSKGERPEIPENSMPKELELLIRRMWDGDFAKRPGMGEIAKTLQDISVLSPQITIINN